MQNGWKTMARRVGAAMAMLSLTLLLCSYSYPFASYSVTDDNEVMLAPEAVRFQRTLTGLNLGAGAFNTPMCIRSSSTGEVYIADTGNSRVLVMDKNDTVRLVLQEFQRTDGTQDRLKEPEGLFITSTGELYVADTGNNRVLVFGTDGTFKKEMPQPKSDSLPAGFVYIPKALALDKAGRMYVVAQNVNSGLMEFDESGTFRGYMGANRVSVDFLKVLLKRFSTKEQIERLSQTVPTEYNNITVDSEGFVYVTTSALPDQSISRAIAGRSQDERNAPIRKLNASGADVLQRAGSFPPVGDTAYDYYTVNYTQPSGPSKLLDITVDEAFSYTVLDGKRGHLFTYDSRGNLLYEFGGMSETNAGFRSPVSLTQVDDVYYILDSGRNCIVKYKETAYGAMISQATADYAAGRYEQARSGWEQVLLQNSSCEIAYNGLGLVKYREKDYQSAMEYFKRGRNRSAYSKSYEQYRTQKLTEHFGWIAGIGGGILGVGLGIVWLRRSRRFWKRLVETYQGRSDL